MRSKDLLNRDIAILMVKFRGRIEENGLENVKPEVLGEEEIEKIFNYLGIWFYIMQSEYFDTVTVEMDTDPAKAIDELRKTPTVAIKRAIPLDSIVSAPPEMIISDIQKLVQAKVSKNESFTVKCKLRKNGYNFNGKENLKTADLLSKKIVNTLCRELGLEHDDHDSDWIVQIEELGDFTGIAVCRPENIFN
ncbi:hypothetical protein MBMB1_1087 [Methanobacterium sp. MB1]|jgi:tRNA acetyltransferase TAN1|uniref:THUMP domain-containing protein n=1 Tax=Methanobacterium sp. TaxID=2164 RepID=UPI0003C9852D|nr:THUMP domain-containing protein [uncultured Methanobacterium sp.]CDG65188.1 hypothetical protein MBMB1_1087 [Methanobacterium sp. MB1]